MNRVSNNSIFIPKTSSDFFAAEQEMKKQHKRYPPTTVEIIHTPKDD